MTKDQTARFMAAMSAGWPAYPVGQDTIALWHSAALNGLDFDVALKVMERIVTTDERFPSVARFNAVRLEIERRAKQDEPRRELEAGVAPRVGQRWAKISLLVLAETPGYARGRERRHTHSMDGRLCPTCSAVYALSDVELEERLAAAWGIPADQVDAHMATRRQLLPIGAR